MQRLFGNFTLDGMADDDGHNALVTQFCCPSASLFEADLASNRTWIFPPEDTQCLVIRSSFMIVEAIPILLIVGTNSAAWW